MWRSRMFRFAALGQELGAIAAPTTVKRAGMPELPYRADVDGLRAIAVLAVIGFHANPSSMPGGFAGVDIFFVISGYLIASLILAGLKGGSFSFAEFYARRIRRLFPALIVVLLATWVFGWFILPPTEYAELGRHTLAGAGFAANILNYAEVGYFDLPAAAKPLLHLWSLGVEEQFYIVFPALLLLLWRYKAMSSWLALIGLASFALNIALVGSHPSFTFYLPLTRFWEFIAGALLACAHLYGRTFALPVHSASALPLRDVSAAIGMLLILAGIGFAHEDAFPGWWALLPVLGTFLIIGAGSQAWLNRTVLAHPKLVFVGLISYPLYLWHWPLLVLARTAIRNEQGNEYLRTTAIIAVALTFLLSWLTYRFIERPIRARRSGYTARRTTAALGASLAVIAVVGFAIAQIGGLTMRYPKEVQALLTPLAAGADDPPADESKNSAGPKLLVYGDSHAHHLLAGLRQLQNERSFRLSLAGWGWGCAPLEDIKPNDQEKCRKLAADNEALFAELKPDIVVIGAAWPQYKHLQRISDTVRGFQRIGVSRIVVVGSVPAWPQPPQVMLYKAYRADPRHGVPDRLFGFDTRTLAVDRQLRDITSSLGVAYISAYDALCNDKGCLVRLGDTAKDIVQFDLTHFSAAGSSFFVRQIAQQMFE
jgi:peptidoglycan/LPS O-acetylase OafA/YrhL